MLHPIIDGAIVNTLEMTSLKTSKRNMKYSGCQLNSKMIQDVWPLTKNKAAHQLMKTNLLDLFNKDEFSRITVYLAVQFFSFSVVTILKRQQMIVVFFLIYV